MKYQNSKKVGFILCRLIIWETTLFARGKTTATMIQKCTFTWEVTQASWGAITVVVGERNWGWQDGRLQWMSGCFVKGAEVVAESKWWEEMLGVAWLLWFVQIVESKGLWVQSTWTLMVPMVREHRWRHQKCGCEEPPQKWGSLRQSGRTCSQAGLETRGGASSWRLMQQQGSGLRVKVRQVDCSTYLVSWGVGCGTQGAVWSHVSLALIYLFGICVLDEQALVRFTGFQNYIHTLKYGISGDADIFFFFPPPTSVFEFESFLCYLTFHRT